MNEQTITAMKADWLAFCDQNCKDDYEAIAARVAAPTPKKPARRWIFATSLVAAAAAIALVCLPLLNGHMATSDKMNGGNAPMRGEDNPNDAVTPLYTTLPTTDKGDADGNGGTTIATTPSQSQHSSVITTQTTTGDKYDGCIGVPTPPDKNNGNATTAGTKPTTGNTTAAGGKPTTGDWDGQGGEIYDSIYFYVGLQKHSGLMNLFLDYARQNFPDKVDAAKAKLTERYTGTPYAFTGNSMHFWVRELNMSRETFIEINERSKDFYKDNEYNFSVYTFTDEEIDDIYNLTTAEFNQKYKAPTAVVVGEVIYSFEWFYDNEVDLWLKQSFTVAQLQEAVANAKQTPNFPQSIITEVELKLEKYIFAVG